MFFSDSVDIFLLFPAIDVAVAKSKGGGVGIPHCKQHTLSLYWKLRNCTKMCFIYLSNAQI